MTTWLHTHTHAHIHIHIWTTTLYPTYVQYRLLKISIFSFVISCCKPFLVILKKAVSCHVLYLPCCVLEFLRPLSSGSHYMPSQSSSFFLSLASLLTLDFYIATFLLPQRDDNLWCCVSVPALLTLCNAFYSIHIIKHNKIQTLLDPKIIILYLSNTL